MLLQGACAGTFTPQRDESRAQSESQTMPHVPKDSERTNKHTSRAKTAAIRSFFLFFAYLADTAEGCGVVQQAKPSVLVSIA